MVAVDTLFALSMTSLPTLKKDTLVTDSEDPLTVIALRAMSCIAPPANCRAPPETVNPSSKAIVVVVSVEAAPAVIPAQSPAAAAGHEPDSRWRKTES